MLEMGVVSGVKGVGVVCEMCMCAGWVVVVKVRG